MSTNKDKIIQFIKDETSKCIQNNSYTFEKCNALIISMELFLDRSNVSKTYNCALRLWLQETGNNQNDPPTY